MHIKGYLVSIKCPDFDCTYIVSSIKAARKKIFFPDEMSLEAEQGISYAFVSEVNYILNLSPEQEEEVKNNFDGDYLEYLNSVYYSMNYLFECYAFSRKRLFEVRFLDEDEYSTIKGKD